MSWQALRDWLRGQFEPSTVRRRTHRGALVACGIFACVVGVAILRPGDYFVGPVRIRLDSLRNPFLELAAAVAVALATRGQHRRTQPRASSRFLAAWAGWTVGSRIFAVALSVKAAATAVDLLRLSDDTLAYHRWSRSRFEEPLEDAFRGTERYAQFERFFEACRLELPADARVLYFGRAEGQILAYTLYPRPVFMHPSDRYVAWIGHQLLDYGRPLPDDDLFPAPLPPPSGEPGMDAFVRTHRLTHEVRFVESELPMCRVRAIR